MDDALPPGFTRLLGLWNGADVDPRDVFEPVPDDLAATVSRYRSALPDLEWQIDECLVAGDRYVLRMHAAGTHAGKPFRFEGVELHTVRDDLIVSSDQVWD